MPTDTPSLPKNSLALAESLESHVQRERVRLAPSYTLWRLFTLYMQGYRTFTLFDSTKGIIQSAPYILSQDGKREFQSQELMKIVNDTVGKISSMDARPSVSRNGDDLSSIRERGVAQIILDSVTDSKTLEQVVEEWAYLFVLHGSAGLTSGVIDHASLGLTTDPEVIHPRELMPWPSLGDDLTLSRGIIRQRMIPLDVLAEKFPGVKSRKSLNLMEWYETEIGEESGDPYDYGNVTYTTDNPSRGTTTGHMTSIALATIRELWTYGPNGTVKEYAVTSGLKMIHRQNYGDAEVYCPIQFTRFMNNSMWHGAGLMHLLFSLHREMEDLLKRVFENIRDDDVNSVLVVPASQVPSKPSLVQVGDKHKVLGIQTDPMETSFSPFQLKPLNAGDMPGRTAAYASDLINKLNPIDDLIADKGRIDSAHAMQILQEESQRKLTSPLRGVNRALGGWHRANLAATLRLLQTSPRDIKLTRLSLDLAGVSIDMENGTMSLGESNPIPSLHHLDFNARAVVPVSQGNAKRAAIEMFRATGGADITGLKLHALTEGFMLDMYMEDDKAAYNSVVQDILTLFNDGINPGQIMMNPAFSKPELQLRVLHTFMAGVVYRKGSPEVHNAFQAFSLTLKSYMGTVLDGPPGNPDDFAAIAEARLKQQQQR